MKKVISGLGFVAALLLSQGSAAISIDDARDQYEKGGEVRSLLLFWLGGQENGLSWANVVLESEGQDLLYCQPEKLGLTGENVYRLTDDYIEESGTEGSYPFDMLVLYALQEAFPCD